MSDVFTLYCWVRGTDINQHFGVKISRTENVNALKTLMKQSCPNTFHDVDAAALQLYKPRDPVPAPLDKNLSGFILSEHADMLDGMNKLSALFVVPPPEEHIHIIMRHSWRFFAGYEVMRSKTASQFQSQQIRR
ncbi:hypothetical protein BS17DRAFT_818882 [Gyrodon lividus]|nr:hypothetical protein BS17DRAFT_818882 [Gyrodon lividus]